MITIDSIAASIEQGLNASASAYKFKFKIFVDAGKFEKAEKTRTGKVLFINSLLRVGESSIVPVQGITVATQSAMLEICVPIFNEDQIDEVSTLFRTMLDGYFAMYKVQSIDGYTVSSTYSLASTGSLEARGNIGQSLTFYVNMEFSYIENGLNSSNCTFKLDGFEIPFVSVHINKNATVNSNATSGDFGLSTSRGTAFIRGWDFETVALNKNSGLSYILLTELNGNGLNVPHTFTVNTSLVDKNSENITFTKTYKVIFGSIDMNMQSIDNISYTFSIVERAAYAGGANNA